MSSTIINKHFQKSFEFDENILSCIFEYNGNTKFNMEKSEWQKFDIGLENENEYIDYFIDYCNCEFEEEDEFTFEIQVLITSNIIIYRPSRRIYNIEGYKFMMKSKSGREALYLDLDDDFNSYITSIDYYDIDKYKYNERSLLKLFETEIRIRIPEEDDDFKKCLVCLKSELFQFILKHDLKNN